MNEPVMTRLGYYWDDSEAAPSTPAEFEDEIFGEQQRER